MIRSSVPGSAPALHPQDWQQQGFFPGTRLPEHQKGTRSAEGSSSFHVFESCFISSFTLPEKVKVVF